MNRNTLLIAIAAVVVVGIAVGLLLVGAGQTGSLQGASVPIPTSLDLIVSNCSPPDARGYSSFTITGHLMVSGGVVANRTVNLVGVFPERGISAVEQFVTGRDGSFRVTRDVLPSANATDNYQAFFYGDAEYGPSTSEKVYRPC